MKHLLAEIDHHSRDRKVLAGEKKGCPAPKRIEQPMFMVRNSEAASNISGSKCGQPQLPGEAQTNLLVAHWQRNISNLPRQR